MKTIAKTIILAILSMSSYHGLSQHGYTRALDIDVRGVFIGGQYTKAQVVAKWGNPTKYWSMMSEFGLDEEYKYTVDQLENIFSFGDNGRFHSFIIKTSNFPVYSTYSGGIKVGDNISRIAAIGLGTPILQKGGKYHLYRNNIDSPLVFIHMNGVITGISFVSLV